MSRSRFTPTKEDSIRVAVLVACGTPQTEIARQVINPETGVSIDEKTLRQCFRLELDEGKKAANAMVARALFKRATGEGTQSVTAAIFWLKTQAGWCEARDQQDDPLGKKELKQEAAKIASSGKFAPSSPPKLVVNNQ